jgi:lipopolysaccharide export system protein LptA
MRIKLRKLCIWLISLGAVLVIYLLVNLISNTGPIEISTRGDTGANFADTAAESNTVEFDGKIGKVGDVGVGTIQKAKYTHLDSQKQVDREFGFEKLLHAEGNEWEIEKPYMNIYRHNLKCYMTADEGKVRVEDAVGRATPTDATLTGNVVIHVLPEEGSSVEESFIYLDDVIFTSEKSQFSTAGPVKFTSQDAQMEGSGLELVYNDGLDRLEFLKIINLESLRIRQSSKASLISSQASGASHAAHPLETSREEQTEQPEKRDKGRETGGGEYYKCIFRGNVVIDCPEQVILADEVSINNILWSGVSGTSGAERRRQPWLGGHPQADKVSDSPRPLGAGEKSESRDSPAQRWAGPGEPNESPEQFVDLSGGASGAARRRQPWLGGHPQADVAEAKADIVVTCDNGITVVPMDCPEMSEKVVTDDNSLKTFNDKRGRPTFIARRIDYCIVKENIVANGPSELTFYANDIMGAEGRSTAVPIKVTAREKAEFLPALNQVIFEGNVQCSMLRENVNFQQKYALSAPKFTVDLSKDKQFQANIKHLTASGEVVQLDTSKWAGGELLGFTKLKCLRFDYDAAQQMFLAAGSGIIAVDNSKIAEPGKKVGKFSLQRPCYAVVRNFDTLKYLKEADLITADAGSEQILIDYFPVVKGKQEQQTSATANHIEAVLYETSSGQTELSTLRTKGGITYEEGKEKKGKTVQFVGSEMFYDSGKSMITAWGDQSQPCFLNGALAPGIEYDLKTGTIKTKIIGPGMLQMGR